MLSLVPISLREANEFVRRHHRHHKPTVGHKFSIGVQEDGRLAGVAICGRPVSRFLDDGYTLEVNRLCTDGARNACLAFWGRMNFMGRYSRYTIITDSAIEPYEICLPHTYILRSFALFVYPFLLLIRITGFLLSNRQRKE